MATTEQPRVTVVTPVYNGEKHITTTIQSVQAQTYPNWEYIIVNNCSTDRTLEIAQSFAQRDPRIRVMSNESLLNVVDSHNRAFSVAPPENKYIKIVAADDWLFPDCLTEMVALAEAHPNVGMVTSYVLSGNRIGFDGLPFKEMPFQGTVVDGREMCRMRLLKSIFVFGGPSASLLRTSEVKKQQPFYTIGNYHGDNDAYFRLLQRNDFGFVHQVLTYRRRGEDSRTTHMLESFNSHILNVVEELVTFGPIYLKPEELQPRLKESTDEYYRFLARQAFEFRGKKFWDTHFQRLKILGTPFDYGKFSRFVIARFFDMLLNPKRTIEGAFRRLAR
jgi:glycosyltransferase involved in cell wall biosynthesis